jgi:HlyD family secretion protein
MRTRTAVALSAGTVVLGALVVWLVQPAPVVVETAEVTKGLFEQVVSDDGKTRVRDRYIVAAPLAGRVERIRLRPGDLVERGQTVAVLTPSAPALLDARTELELEARAAAAEAQRMRAASEAERARAQRDQARNEVSRQARLAQQGFVSRTALEQAELQLRTSEKAVDAARFAEQAAQHEVAQARAARVRYQGEGPGMRWEVKSPVRGSVLRVAHESEGAVALGEALIEIADPGSLEAVVDILSQDALAMKPGLSAHVDLGSSVSHVEARVRRIEPSAFTKVSALGIEEQRVNVVLDFLDQAKAVATLGDGYRVEAHIVVFRADEAVRVPVSALFREGDRWAVYVVDGERALKRLVHVTRRNGSHALVEDGLSPGQKVVIYPPEAIEDGAKIRTP